MTAPGPKRQFAAVQRYGRCRLNTGRSVDAADTALLTQTGLSESVATLDRVPRLEDHVTLGELGRIDEAF
jgi:hypothetical protein